MEPLVERGVELAGIVDLIDRATRGMSGILLVEGPAGIGKTRLLHEAAGRAQEERVLVLRARGGELERSFPFGIVAQLFGAAVEALEAEQRRTVLSGAAELAVELITPRAVKDARADSSSDALYARLHGLYWLCAGLAATRPLMLVVDDVQWADEPSLQWLLFWSSPGFVDT